MKTTNTLKNAINPNNLGYSKVHTNLFDDGKTYEYFKLESDGHVYVLCIDTNRCTRYNGEGQNGKRIGMEAYLTARETLESEAKFKDIMEQAEESATTEELKEIQKEMAPKAKKTRKSKDAFHTSIAVSGLTLTAKQTSFLLHLSDTNFWENGLDSCIWVDILCDEIGGEFAGKPMTVGAMISTLCEKGLGTRATDRRDGRKCTNFALTELGKIVAAELGLH